MTTKWSKTAPSLAAATLAQAFKVNLQFVPVTILLGCIDYNRNVIGNFALD
jgi:hypothetical protein